MTLKTLLDTPLDDVSFAVVDTETTGMFAEHNKVMDIGIVLIDQNEITNSWETLINPQQDVPYWITTYTKLTNQDVDNEPPFEHFATDIQDLLKKRVFVAHNVMFDYWFLFHEFKRLGVPFEYPKLCTVKLGRKLLPLLGSASLDSLTSHYGIEIEARHRALPDAQATAEILLDFIQKAKIHHNAKTFFDLERLQRIHTTTNHRGIGLF